MAECIGPAANYFALTVASKGSLGSALPVPPMESRLREKTEQYEDMLAAALANVRCDETDRQAAEEVLEMAQAYLADGRYFWQHDDPVNALAAYSYGHGWIDAGIRCGVLSVNRVQ